MDAGTTEDPEDKGLITKTLEAARNNLKPIRRSSKSERAIERAVRLHDSGVARHRQGRDQEAKAFFLEAVDLLAGAGATARPDLAAVLIDLGAVCELRCEYRDAEGHYAKAADLLEGAEGWDDVARLQAESRRCLGGIYRILGRYPEAERYIRRAIALCETRDIGDGLPLSAALNDLGPSMAAIGSGFARSGGIMPRTGFGGVVGPDARGDDANGWRDRLATVPR